MGARSVDWIGLPPGLSTTQKVVFAGRYESPPVLNMEYTVEFDRKRADDAIAHAFNAALDILGSELEGHTILGAIIVQVDDHNLVIGSHGEAVTRRMIEEAADTVGRDHREIVYAPN